MKINISIDDITPHPKSSLKVLDRCYELLTDFPQIKFTLFIPMAYTRFQERTYCINEFPEFCDCLRKLPQDIFELGWHGYHHGIIGQSNNDEFRYLSYDEACVVLSKMVSMAKQMDIFDLFSPILRPSAFYMSPGSIKACGCKAIKILALSREKIHKDSYSGEDEKFNRVVYYDSNPPFKPLIVKDSLEIVYHACEWDQNYLSKEMAKELSLFLNINSHEVEFAFMRDM